MTSPLHLVRRGHIVWVSFDPAVGSESSKTRPAVVVSNNTANASALRSERGVITVVPLTTSLTHVHEFQVRIHARDSGLDRDSKAQAEQVRTVSITRVSGIAGWIGGEAMGEIDDALRLHLSL